MARFIFARVTKRDVHLVRVWARSWAKHGWTPRLYYQEGRKVWRTNPRALKLPVVPLRVINFGLRPGKGRLEATPWHKHGEDWKKDALVLFPGSATEFFITHCGRKL